VWYAVLCMRARDCTLTPNAACEVSFDGLPHTLQATVYHMTQQGNQVLVVLQMTQGAQEMVSLRQVTGHIGRSAEGFKIPLKALQSDENGYFVQVRAQGGVTAVRVEVLAMDERHAIVGEVAGSGGALVVGMRLVNP